jgi:hypothetical protein
MSVFSGSVYRRHRAQARRHNRSGCGEQFDEHGSGVEAASHLHPCDPCPRLERGGKPLRGTVLNSPIRRCKPGQWRRIIADKRGGSLPYVTLRFSHDNADKLCRTADALPTTIRTELGVCPKQSERRSTPSAAAPIIDVCELRRQRESAHHSAHRPLEAARAWARRCAVHAVGDGRRRNSPRLRQVIYAILHGCYIVPSRSGT